MKKIKKNQAKAGFKLEWNSQELRTC